MAPPVVHNIPEFENRETEYYINSDEWQPYLEIAIERSIRPASIDIFEGKLKPQQISQSINRETLIRIAQKLLELTYIYAGPELTDIIDQHLAELPGGQEWF